jgi:hypothetical protein
MIFAKTSEYEKQKKLFESYFDKIIKYFDVLENIVITKKERLDSKFHDMCHFEEIKNIGFTDILLLKKSKKEKEINDIKIKLKKTEEMLDYFIQKERKLLPNKFIISEENEVLFQEFKKTPFIDYFKDFDEEMLFFLVSRFKYEINSLFKDINQFHDILEKEKKYLNINYVLNLKSEEVTIYIQNKKNYQNEINQYRMKFDSLLNTEKELINNCKILVERSIKGAFLKYRKLFLQEKHKLFFDNRKIKEYFNQFDLEELEKYVDTEIIKEKQDYEKYLEIYTELMKLYSEERTCENNVEKEKINEKINQNEKEIANFLGEENISFVHDILVKELEKINDLTNLKKNKFEKYKQLLKRKRFLEFDKKMDIRDLIAVHKTNFFPYDCVIKTTGQSSDFNRETIHFSLNGPVGSHMYGNWDNCPIAILIPVINMYKRFLDLFPHDSCIIGELKLSKGTEILVQEEFYAKNNIASLKLPEYINIIIVPKNIKLDDFIKERIRERGYLPLDIGMWSGSVNSKEEQIYNKYKNYGNLSKIYNSYNDDWFWTDYFIKFVKKHNKSNQIVQYFTEWGNSLENDLTHWKKIIKSEVIDENFIDENFNDGMDYEIEKLNKHIEYLKKLYNKYAVKEQREALQRLLNEFEKIKVVFEKYKKYIEDLCSLEVSA